MDPKEACTKSNCVFEIKIDLTLVGNGTRHSIASELEGKLKNHPTQCIPPNTPPTTGIQKKNPTKNALSPSPADSEST